MSELIGQFIVGILYSSKKRRPSLTRLVMDHLPLELLHTELFPIIDGVGLLLLAGTCHLLYRETTAHVRRQALGKGPFKREPESKDLYAARYLPLFGLLMLEHVLGPERFLRRLLGIHGSSRLIQCIIGDATWRCLVADVDCVDVIWNDVESAALRQRLRRLPLAECLAVLKDLWEGKFIGPSRKYCGRVESFDKWQWHTRIAIGRVDVFMALHPHPFFAWDTGANYVNSQPRFSPSDLDDAIRSRSREMFEFALSHCDEGLSWKTNRFVQRAELDIAVDTCDPAVFTFVLHHVDRSKLDQREYDALLQRAFHEGGPALWDAIVAAANWKKPDDLIPLNRDAILDLGCAQQTNRRLQWLVDRAYLTPETCRTLVVPMIIGDPRANRAPWPVYVPSSYRAAWRLARQFPTLAPVIEAAIGKEREEDDPF